MRKVVLNLLIALPWIAGNLTPLFFLWLIWPRLGSITPFCKLHLNPTSTDLLVAIIFPLQHSVWTQPRVKDALKAWLGELLERPGYVLTSGLALAATAILWQPSESLIWRLPAAALWPMRILFLASIGVQTYCATLLGAKSLIGVAHVKAMKLGRPLNPPQFKEAGPYRFIRHPIAATQIIQLWLTPSMYADRFLLAALWTFWIAFVTLLEDRRLAIQFGDVYLAYRKRTGFLWPRIS